MILAETSNQDTFQVLKTVNTIQELNNGYYRFYRNENGIFLNKTSDIINPEVKILNGIESDKIYEDIENWISKEKEYSEFNFPYKRGIFLYGSPGLGKTKIIESVLKKLNHKKLIAFNIQDPDELKGIIDIINDFDLSGGILKDYLKIFILEDIESMIEYKSAETTLLQLLDGNIKIHKCLFFATTNYPEKIPNRILSRPSRFDRKIHIQKPDPHLIKQYVDSFNIEGSDSILTYLSDYSFAQIKEFIISYYLFNLPVEYIQSELKEFKENNDIGFNKKINKQIPDFIESPKLDTSYFKKY